jgi:hypothetical protein
LQFVVSGTLKRADIEVSICKDPDCMEETRVFAKDETVYLTFDSQFPNPDVEASLILPDGAVKQISLPEALNEELLGTYTLEVTASQEGYTAASLREQFGIIEEHAGILYESFPQEAQDLTPWMILLTVIIVGLFAAYMKRRSSYY